MLWVLICSVHLTVCYYHVINKFQSESILYSCLDVKELLAWNRCDIWILSDSNGIWIHSGLVRKRRPDALAKLAKLLSCCKNLSVRCTWLHVIIMSRTRLRLMLHSIVAWTIQTKWLWVRIPLLSLTLQMSYLFGARRSLTFDIQPTIACWFTLKQVRDMIITYSPIIRVHILRQKGEITTISFLTRLRRLLVPWRSLNWLNGWGREITFGV